VLNGPGRLGPGTLPGPIAPTHRPRWLLVLSALTLMYGGMLLMSALSDLGNPTMPVKLPVTQSAEPEKDAVTRELLEVNAAMAERHARAIRGRAAAAVALALILLYSAAAVLSRDRHGRTVTLTAASLSIVYQLGCLPAVIPIAKDYASVGAPVIARLIILNLRAAEAEARPAVASPGGGGAPAPPDNAKASDSGAATPPAPAAASGESLPRPEEITPLVQKLIVGEPIAMAILGILTSLLMITYFGGRRGRALYGLPPRRPPPLR